LVLVSRPQQIATIGAALLEQLTVDELKPLAALTGAPLPTRKAELARVVTTFLEGDGLRDVFDRLDELQQAAVAEVVHGPDSQFHPARFVAKYRQPPSWGSLNRYGRGGSPSLLRLFFYNLDGCLVMPEDLQERLRAFVPPPPEPEITAEAELPSPETDDPSVVLAVHVSEPAARRELLSVLRLVEAGQITVSDKTGRPSAKTIARIEAVLEEGDFYAASASALLAEEPPGPIRAFAWPMLLQAGGLVQRAATKAQLTAAGRKALGDPAQVSLIRLWKRWLGTTVLDELARVDAVKGQTGTGRRGLTAVAARRSAIAATLARCPAGRWINFDDLVRYIWATNNSFAVTRDPWRLYIGHPEYGSLGYEDTGLLLEERYLACLLFEYATTLGILDVAYVQPGYARTDFTRLWGASDLPYLSRYDGLRYIRITAIGARALEIEGAGLVTAPPLDPSLRVLANLEIVATSAEIERADRMALDAFAVAVSDRVWRLEQARLLAVAEKGWAVRDVTKFLTDRSADSLPPSVVQMLSDVAARCDRLTDRGLARLVECHDAALAALLAHDRKTAGHCLQAGERSLVVPASSEAAFRRGLRDLGYLLRSEEIESA